MTINARTLGPALLAATCAKTAGYGAFSVSSSAAARIRSGFSAEVRALWEEELAGMRQRIKAKIGRAHV